jgi:predicted HicB family RNase H-like nuclease
MHKGYIAKIEFDNDDKVLHGRILGIRDVITFESESVEGAITAFEESVDDYLAFCEERNEEPEKPFSGKFNLRIEPELHRGISMLAALEDISMNLWAIKAIEKAFLEDLKTKGMYNILLPKEIGQKVKELE